MSLEIDEKVKAIVDDKIKSMEEEIKRNLQSGQLKLGTKPKAEIKTVEAPFKAKLELLIQHDATGVPHVRCPQSEFGADIVFCQKCKFWKGNKDNKVFCDYDIEKQISEEEI